MLLNRMRNLSRSGGPKLALVTKKDLGDLVQMVDQMQSDLGGTILTQALARNVFLRDEIARLNRHNDILADAVRERDRNAKNHGDERRRFMGNNRALIAQAATLEESVTEMVATINRLTDELTDAWRNYGEEAAKGLLLGSHLAIIRAALDGV